MNPSAAPQVPDPGRSDHREAACGNCLHGVEFGDESSIACSAHLDLRARTGNPACEHYAANPGPSAPGSAEPQAAPTPASADAGSAGGASGEA